MLKVVRPSRPIWCFTTRRIIVLCLCFALQEVITVHFSKPYDAYLALSGYGMKSGHLWELFTYQFLHTGPIHFLVNLLGLWFLGRWVEAQLGTRRFYFFFTTAVILGGLLQGIVAVMGYVLPESMETVAEVLRDRFGDQVMGGTVGLCACVGAYCRLRPRAKPLSPIVPLDAAQLSWILVVGALVFVFVRTNDNQAHLAHLGGLLTGLLLVGAFNRPKPVSPPPPVPIGSDAQVGP